MAWKRGPTISLSVIIMNGLRTLYFFFPKFCILLTVVASQDLQESVDLVTRLNNDMLPSLLGSLVAQQENVVVGPFGVASNLAIALEASSGKTRQEIFNALNVTGNDVVALRIGFKAYCDLFLEHSSHSESSGAFNSVAVQSGFPMPLAYRSILGKHYCANITGNVTEGPALRLESHAGVMSHWKDYEKLAVYTFLSHQPIRPFNKRDGFSVPVPVIPLVGVFKAVHWRNSQVVLLPLENNMVSFVLILPDDPNQIDALAKTLTANSLMEMLTSLESMELEIFLPQLTIVNKKQDLTPLLRAKGVNLAFDPEKADLTRASDKTHQTFLQHVQQDAFFSTSFVALNSVSGVSSNLDLKKRSKREVSSKIYFNQPFLFLVIHRDTYLVLLAGKVENPVQVPV